MGCRCLGCCGDGGVGGLGGPCALAARVSSSWPLPPSGRGDFGDGDVVVWEGAAIGYGFKEVNYH